MQDIVYVTGEAARFDYRSEMEYISSLDPIKGISAGHYTRPSLSSIHSSNYAGAIRTQPVSPTIGEVLDDAGYTCIGMTTNPQAQPTFGFDNGYEHYDNFVSPGGRGSRLREFLGRFTIAQYVYQRLFPRHKRRASKPSDAEVVEMAVEKFNEADAPRFLWLHIMESHRPYGIDGTGISPELNRKAKFRPTKVSSSQRSEIRSAYAGALGRVDDLIQELLDELDSDPLFAFSGDHGELLGEYDTYFHPPHEQLLHDELIEVPVAFDGLDVKADRISLIDIPPTLLGAVGIDVPGEWDGRDARRETRDEFMTWAPWLNDTELRWQSRGNEIQLSGADADFSTRSTTGSVEDIEKSEEVTERLRNFGYMQ
jgi:arylsulfatase A-like enzyme